MVVARPTVRSPPVSSDGAIERVLEGGVRLDITG